MSSPDDPYLIPGTDVLHNKHGITNKTKLDERESELAGIRIREFRKNPPPVQGKFDDKHLGRVHAYIFQDTYFAKGEHEFPIAGEKRVIGITKKHDPDYPHPDHPHPDGNLDKRLEYAFDQLKKDNNLQGIKDDKTFIEKLAQHTTEIWLCHQFREGNSRSMQVFTRQLARSTGRDISLAKILEDKLNYRETMKVSAFGNPEPLKQMLSRALSNGRAKQVKESTPRYEPSQQPTDKALVKSAMATLDAETEKQFSKLKAPLEADKRKLETKVGQLKTQLQQFTAAKAPLVGKSNHRNVGVMLENRLTAAKHDLYEFSKQYKTEVPKLRKQAGRIAEKKHPEALATISKSKDTAKVQQQQRNHINRTTSNHR